MSADCPNPQNQCLIDGDMFIATRGFDKGYISVYPATTQGQQTPSGEAQFLRRSDGKVMSTGHFWSTHPAQPNELQIGKLAVFFTRTDDGIRRPPKTRERANSRWLLARIVNVANVADGYVITSGGMKVGIDTIRMVDGDDSPTTVVDGAEDSHFLKTGHWMISDNDLTSGYHSVYPAAAVKLPSAATKGEGQFYNLNSGELVWTSHAWQTRIADKSSVKPGDLVFFFTRTDHGVRVPPKERNQALGRWLGARVVDTSSMFKGVIGVAKGMKVSLAATRVVR